MAMTATEKELSSKIDKMAAHLERLAKPMGSHTPQKVFSVFGPTPKDGWGWPSPERMEALSKAYDHQAAVHMLTNSKGKPRAAGWGSALLKMAKMANRQLTTGIDIPDGYDAERFEKEHGFVTVQKAAQVGIKGLNGEVRKAALAEGSGITGGYVVPPQFLNELMTIAAEDAFVEPRCKVIPMTNRTLTIPMLDLVTSGATGVSPYFGGIVATWQPEAATIDETEPQFRQGTWTAWDLVMYTVSSNQLLMDNGIGLDALLTQLFAQAMTWYKEYAFLRGLGAGSSMPLGVLNAPATYTQLRNTSSRFLLADAAAMMSRLQVRSWDSACWVMHQSVLPQLIQMVDAVASNTSPAGNRLVWQNPVMPGDSGPVANKLPNAFLNGLPIFFTEKLPQLGTTGDVILVDFSHYVVGNRLDMQIDVSPHYLFRNNQLAWRVVARCDGQPWLSNTITDASGWVSSPFVQLSASTS